MEETNIRNHAKQCVDEIQLCNNITFTATMEMKKTEDIKNFIEEYAPDPEAETILKLLHSMFRDGELNYNWEAAREINEHIRVLGFSPSSVKLEAGKKTTNVPFNTYSHRISDIEDLIKGLYNKNVSIVISPEMENNVYVLTCIMYSRKHLKAYHIKEVKNAK